MKKITMFLSICTTVAILALPVAARNAIAQPDNASKIHARLNKAKTLVPGISEESTNDQAKAYEAAKKYLACPAAGRSLKHSRRSSTT